MYIKKLFATFGCLENKTLELSPGLNIISAPNESGKSTWSAFIRAMFYGISTREKARTGHIPDKERYRPWSGSAMYGRMELHKNGEELEIERTSRFDVFSKETAQNLRTGSSFETGEALVGVSAGVYKRTAFIGQSKIKIDGDRDTERLILSIASGNDEDVSAAEVIGRLEKRRRALRSPRGLGSLVELEREIERLRSGALPEGLSALRDECHSLSLVASRAETALSDARLALAAAEKEISSFPAFEGMSDSRAEITATQDIERLRDVQKRRVSTQGIISLFLAAACALLGVSISPWFIPGAAALAATGVVLLLTKGRRARKSCESEMQARYGSSKAEDIEACLHNYVSSFTHLEAAKANVQKLEKEARSAKKEAYIKENEFREELRAKEAEADLRLSEANELLSKLTLEFEAYELAAAAISEADNELRSRFSPELEKRTAEIFASLTDGAYDRIAIKNADFDLDVAKGQASTPRSALMLSQGTADGLYLSLRLALCELTLGDEDAPPIILDDALVNFDDMRMAKALDLIKEFSKTRQVLLFSCHGREAKYFESDDDVNKIKL